MAQGLSICDSKGKEYSEDDISKVLCEVNLRAHLPDILARLSLIQSNCKFNTLSVPASTIHQWANEIEDLMRGR